MEGGSAHFFRNACTERGNGVLENKLNAVRLYESGMTFKQIAENIGVAPMTAYRWIKESGVPMRRKGWHSKGRPREFDPGEARALYLSGMTEHEIAQRIGSNVSSVSLALRSLGVKTRSMPEYKSSRSIGNRTLSSGGYVRVQVGAKLRQYEHILLAENVVGRPLKRGEVVHHINCDRTDNRPENLLVCKIGYHMALHARMRKHPYWSQFKNRRSQWQQPRWQS